MLYLSRETLERLGTEGPAVPMLTWSLLPIHDVRAGNFGVP